MVSIASCQMDEYPRFHWLDDIPHSEELYDHLPWLAERNLKLSKNKENETPLLAAQTTARRKGNRDMEKRIFKAKSPGKKLNSDQRRFKPSQSQKKTIIRLRSH